MKTLGRIFIILFAFVLLSGLMVIAVNASGVGTQAFGDGAPRPEFRPQAGEQGELQFRPEGERQERGGERGGGNGAFMLFGMIKNIVVIGFFVVVIAWPRSLAKKAKRAPVAS